ncbi:uncharacterized protein LOC119105399 [Pollicipes pollicipes]|uniref:uncharacterized protein LOC119105399 n=1 Tax=Pollicipes pollicipes TaxID=41117 RepID=UPI001884A8CC|nr:uncharacterized protein LOC119105399 [Pollicipes pollicipes]
MDPRRRWNQCNGNACSRASPSVVDPDSIELTCVPPLPQDLEQHIRECQCSCDHLGFGNFKTITYVEGQHWDSVDVIDVKPSASTVDILDGELPAARSSASPDRLGAPDKKVVPDRLITRQWCPNRLIGH